MKDDDEMEYQPLSPRCAKLMHDIFDKIDRENRREAFWLMVEDACWSIGFLSLLVLWMWCLWKGW